MSKHLVSPRLRDALLCHLEQEETVLRQVQQFSQELTAGGFPSSHLAEHQGELALLLDEMLHLQMNRQDLRQVLSQVLRCDSAQVRLLHLTFPNSQDHDEFQRRRTNLLQLANQTRATLSATERTLRGWSGIVAAVLGSVLESTVSTDRYSSTGQKLTTSRPGGIDVRT